MKCKIFIPVFAFIYVISGYAGQSLSDSLSIEISAPQLKNKQLTLCSYFNDKIYKRDSLTVSDKGSGAFHLPRKVEEGLYLIYWDENHYFDLLLADSQILHLEIDTTDFIFKNKISGNKQTEAFAEYVRFISTKQKERTELLEKSNRLQQENKSSDEVNKKSDLMNQEVKAFQNAFFSAYKDQWVGKFFLGLEAVNGPFPHPQSQEEATKEFYYLKEHYFDKINLQDVRFWRTNYFPQMVTNYMNKYVEQVPDSLAEAALRLVKKTAGDSTCFQLMLTRLTNYSIESKIMGMENIWAKLAENYYLKTKMSWVDSAFISNMTSEYNKIRYNRIGMKAHNIPLLDSLNKPIDLYGTSTKYTLICFFEPECGHCKTIIPRIYNETYQKFGDKGLDICCIYILTDRKEWMDFIHTNQLEGQHWHNLWDPNRTSRYWQFFDTSTTPSIYLLDENKKIIAKKLDVENLNNILEHLLATKKQ